MATLTADSVLNILEEISDLRGESTTNSDAVRIRAVSKAERLVAKRKMFVEHLVRLSTVAGSGASDYTIGSATFPMRKKGLSEVFVGGLLEEQRYAVVDYFTYQNNYNNNNSAKLAYEWYDQTNDLWKIHINPVVQTGTTIYYSYYFMPPKRTSTSDVVICPDMEAVVQYALAFIYEGEEEEEKAYAAKTVGEQVINELMGLEVMPAQNQLRAMGSITNQTVRRSIGSY